MTKDSEGIINYGIKLFQPWADEIVKGNLTLLIKTYGTLKRERIAIIVAKKILDSDLEKIPIEKFQYYHSTFGYAVGSVFIRDVLRVPVNNIHDDLKNENLMEQVNKYPDYFIPNTTKEFVFFWLFSNPKKWKKPIKNEKLGRKWIKISIPEE